VVILKTRRLQDDNVIVQNDGFFAIPKDEGLVWFMEERLCVDVRLGNVSRAKSSRPLVCRRLERVRLWIDCMDRCSRWPDQERPCPTKVRVERLGGGIVIALSADGQLIALIDMAGRMAMHRQAA
jgi:hypothetical protein